MHGRRTKYGNISYRERKINKWKITDGKERKKERNSQEEENGERN